MKKVSISGKNGRRLTIYTVIPSVYGGYIVNDDGVPKRFEEFRKEGNYTTIIDIRTAIRNPENKWEDCGVQDECFVNEALEKWGKPRMFWFYVPIVTGEMAFDIFSRYASPDVALLEARRYRDAVLSGIYDHEIGEYGNIEKRQSLANYINVLSAQFNNGKCVSRRII